MSSKERLTWTAPRSSCCASTLALCAVERCIVTHSSMDAGTWLLRQFEKLTALCPAYARSFVQLCPLSFESSKERTNEEGNGERVRTRMADHANHERKVETRGRMYCMHSENSCLPISASICRFSRHHPSLLFLPSFLTSSQNIITLWFPLS